MRLLFTALVSLVLLVACGGSDRPAVGFGSSGSGTYSDLSAEVVTALAARPLRAAAGGGSTGPVLDLPADQVLDWAESRYGELFPTQETTRTYEKYQYRYYPATNVYLGVAEGRVFLLGAKATGGLIVEVGNVAQLAPRIVQCDQGVPVDPKGSAQLPVGAYDVEAPVDVDSDMGSVEALYPNLNTTTDGFYPNLPCEGSIGGTLPPPESPPEGVADAEEFLKKFEDGDWTGKTLESLLNGRGPSFEPLADFTQSPCSIRTEGNAAGPGGVVPVDCNDPRLLNAAMPFEGRDIIYVHGLYTDHLADRIQNPGGGAGKLWPQDSSEFLSSTGYYRKKAEAYWTPHIIEHLGPPPYTGSGPWGANSGWQWTAADSAPVYVPKSNRFLVVAWNSSQSIEYAQHALLTQIHLAMTTNLNVQKPASFPAGITRPFCANGCVVIGHSTGPLITSSAFGRAAEGDFGAGGRRVVQKMLVHVSMDGAISGSRIATAGLAIANLGMPLGAAAGVVCAVAGTVVGPSNACSVSDLSFLNTSVLRDLVPLVAQTIWGPKVENSPVPTVTIAGGHPRGNQALGLTQWLLPGMDDGVVTMNSACGNNNSVFPWALRPSGITVSSRVKAFEFSEWLPRLVRGTKLWLSQNHMSNASAPSNYLAGGCSPYLSSAGMILPVSNAWSGTNFDTHNRYRNHYSFIQSLAEHSYDGGASPLPSLWPSYVGGAASALREYAPLNATGTTEVSGINVEETRVVTDGSVYTRLLDANGTKLLKPVDMREYVRGRKLSFHFPFNIGNCTKQGVFKWYCTRWIWKRTYHLADKWEQKQSSHYVYEFVARR